jgi:alpha-mannosidase
VRIETSIAIPAAASADRRSRSRELVMTDVEIELSLNHGSPVVDGVVRIDNRASDHRLRLLIPTGASTVTESRADTAFGVLARPAKRAPLSKPSPEAPVNGYPMQSFVDAGDASCGVTVLSEGLMEFEVVGGEAGRQAAIGLTLIRSVGWLSREDLATRKGNAGPSLATPGAQCIGSYEFRFAFAPRSAPPSEAELCAMGRAFLAPPSAVVGTNGPKEATPLGRRHSFFQAAVAPAGTVTLSALKKADDRDAVIVRLMNAGSRPVESRITPGSSIRAAHSTNLREQRQAALTVQEGAALVTLGPRKIATIEIV